MILLPFMMGPPCHQKVWVSTNCGAAFSLGTFSVMNIFKIPFAASLDVLPDHFNLSMRGLT